MNGNRPLARGFGLSILVAVALVPAVADRASAQSGTPPGEFDLYGPDEGAVFDLGEDLRFSWQDSAGAETYRLTVATDAILSDVVYSREVFPGVWHEFHASELVSSGDYYWGVTASNSDGDTDSSPLARNILVIADTFRPFITSTYPHDGDNSVSPSAKIKVSYNERIDEASTGGTVTVTGPHGVVAGIHELWTDGRTVFFTPDEWLEVETTYTVTVAPTVTDVAGNFVVRAAVHEYYEFSFTTEPWLVSDWPEGGCTPSGTGGAATLIFLGLAGSAFVVRSCGGSLSWLRVRTRSRSRSLR